MLRWLATPVLGYGLPFITYFPFLLAAGLWGARRGGFTALVLSTFAADWLFFRPDDPLRLWALGSFLISGGLVVIVGAGASDTVRSLREARARQDATEAQLRTMVGELAHRSRNAMTVIMGMVSQTLRKADSLEDAERTLNARLDALGRSQEEVARAGGGATLIPALLARALEPFDLDRFDIVVEGAPLVPAEAAAAVTLLAHELATNATKYGALSTSGRVHIRCRAAPEVSHIEWREAGGPPVSKPTSLGFGDRLLRAALHPHGGRAERRFEVDGVVCEIEIPAPGEAPRDKPAVSGQFRGAMESTTEA